MCRPHFPRKWQIFAVFMKKLTFQQAFRDNPTILALKMFVLNSAFQNGSIFKNIPYIHRNMIICASLNSFRKWHISAFFTEKFILHRDYRHNPTIFPLKLFALNSQFQNGCTFGNIFYTHRDMNICAGLIFSENGTFPHFLLNSLLFTEIIGITLQFLHSICLN